MGRKERKIEHIEWALEQEDNEGVFNDVQLVGSCLPELNLEDISIKTSLAGISLGAPIVINAITGGNKYSYWINQSLALVSAQLGIAMAVGSQKAALNDPGVRYTFEVVRKVNTDGIIFANTGADVTPGLAQEAVDMINAQALQVHLNVGQELVMREGDKKFKGYLENIKKLSASISVPIIVKEVGQGIAKKEAKQLFEAGVSAIDISGYGGTNFIQIESNRRNDKSFSGLLNWGIKTPNSLLEVLSVKYDGYYDNKDIIASGGISSSIDAYKALVLGARCVGVAGFPLRVLMKEGQESLYKKLDTWLCELKYLLLLSGVDNIEDTKKIPAVIRGDLREYARNRGLKTRHFANRDKND